MAGRASRTLLTLLSNALLPILAGLVLGYVAGLRRVVDNQNIKSLVVFLMSFALPCYLFETIERSSPVDLFAQRDLAAVLAVVYLATFAFTFVFPPPSHLRSTSDSAVLALTLAFPNATAVGLPLLETTYGPSGNVVCAAAIAIGAITISPITLAILEGANRREKARPFVLILLSSVWKAMKRPVVWAPVLGIVAVALGVHLPTYAERTLSLIGSATAGVALFITGLVVSAQPFQLDLRVCLWVLLKNIGQPVACLILAGLFLPVQQVRYAVLICAIPCGFFGVVFGKGFDSTPQDASSSLIASYIVGIITLAGWIVFLNHLPQGFLWPRR